MAKMHGVSVGGDGMVWAVDEGGNIYQRVGSSWKRNTHGMASEVAVGGDGNVWCRNDDGEVFKLAGRSYDGYWEKDKVAKNVTSISAASDGSVWVANEAGQAFMREDGTWKQNPTAKDVVEVAVGNGGTVYYRNKTGNIFKLSGNRFNDVWAQDTGVKDVTSIGVGFDRTIWVTNKKDQLQTKVGNAWTTNDKGKARQVSVGKSGLVWLVNADGNVFHAQAADAVTHWTAVADPTTVVYTVKDGDQLLAVLRDQNPKMNTAELTKLADSVAKLNGWSGKLGDNYGGKATALKAGDTITLAV